MLRDYLSAPLYEAPPGVTVALPEFRAMEIFMYRFSCCVLLLTAAAWSQTPSALESDPSGWKDIMPPASLAGWVRGTFMNPNPLDPISQWTMDPATGILLCEGNRGHEWLRYDKELADFIFHVEFRFTKIEGGRGYNSGVMGRNSADGTTYVQAQAGEGGTGWLFGSAPGPNGPVSFRLNRDLKEDRVKPAGEWNVFEFKAVGPDITSWVNGAVVSEKKDFSVLKGYVGLEAEGYRIEFRNVKLKELK